MVMHARDAKSRAQHQLDCVDRIRKRLSDTQKGEDDALAAHQRAAAKARAAFEGVQQAEELLQHFEEFEKHMTRMQVLMAMLP